MKCAACGYESAIRLRQCPNCKAFDTFARWLPLRRVTVGHVQRIQTGLGHLDWLLNGGMVAGCAYRIMGDPGCGKSTLALHLAANVGGLYASGEEQPGAIRLRADRLGLSASDIHIGELRSVEDLEDLPAGALVIVDSINVLASAHISGPPGSNAQLAHASLALVQLAQTSGRVVLFIGQVNRDGEAAGLRAVDHIVDGLLEMTAPAQDGDQDSWGTIRVQKHRHGPSGRAINYRHRETGLELSRE